MKPTLNELKVINLSESLYTKKPSSLFRKILKIKFTFKDKNVPTEKSIILLWDKFGLQNSIKFYFNNDEIIKCMKSWVMILYPENHEQILSQYMKEYDNIQQQAILAHEQSPHIRIRWNYPEPKRILEIAELNFGRYCVNP
jgi:hypothetical protein